MPNNRYFWDSRRKMARPGSLNGWLAYAADLSLYGVLGRPSTQRMNIVVLTSVRLLGDGLNACFSRRAAMSVVAVLSDLASLRETLGTLRTDVVLVDVTQGIDLFDVRAIATEWPDVALVALGLNEQRQDVIQCGRAGFCWLRRPALRRSTSSASRSWTSSKDGSSARRRSQEACCARCFERKRRPLRLESDLA